MNYKDMVKQAEKVGGAKLLSPIFKEWKKEGESVVGKLLAVAAVQSTLSTGNYNQYLFETDDGHVKFHMGAATDKEAGALMRVGGIYSITYRGEIRITKGRTVNKFEIVEIDVSALDEKEQGDDVPF